jgi:hypothetical protein
MEQVPLPALNVTTQLAEPTLTVTLSPLGTASPLPVVTLTEKIAEDSEPTLTLLGDRLTLVVVESFFTRKLSPENGPDIEVV